jgi:parallel beta-helix repeat protein
VKQSESRLFLLLLLSVVLVSFPQIRVMKAIGTVYIRSDGSTEGAGLRFSDGVYWFTGDIYGQIVIEKDGVTVEGSGYILHAMNEGNIFLENRSGVALRNIEVVDAPFGIKVVGGRSNEITKSNCSIRLENTTNNSIYGNKKISLLFSNASKNIITENNITGSLIYGIKFQKFSNENIICQNNVTDNTSGIEFHGESNNNTVFENYIVNNADGMIFYSSFNNSIYDNVIAFNYHLGLYFRGCSQNKFFRNDIVENDDQTICWYCSNIWDNGSQGNYWSDYNGTDTDGDGVGDDPYQILTLHLSGESYDNDNYPLMEPIVIPEFPSLFFLVAGFFVVTLVLIAYRIGFKQKGGNK